MNANNKVLIFTDLDGSLLDRDTFKFDKILKYIKNLISKGIFIIPNSSKTKKEIESFNKELDEDLHFIVENGAAIYGDCLSKVNGKIILGESYEILENILKSLSIDIDYPLKPLNNLTDNEATELTGLTGNSLTLMRDRHWSMPFLNPPDSLEEKLINRLSIK